MSIKTPFAVAALAALLPLYAGQADIPQHFSDAAKAKLADSVKIAPSEHQLNIVYFHGNDVEPAKDYERRLSELFVYLQQFYAREMARNGFGHRSFGLSMLPNGNVDITTIKGSLPHKEYPYSGGHGKVQHEVAAYFAAHPEKKRSHHTLILMPTWQDAQYSDANPGGVPFYGVGQTCYALDYADFDLRHLGENTPQGRLLTKWFGGMAHELGHGLNLPHNNGTAQEMKELGTPLMGAGNYTFGMTPTFLTKATCRILDRSETFAPAGDKTAFYTTNEPVTVENPQMKLKDGALVYRFRAGSNFKHVNAYIQDAPFAVNQDYEKVAFTDVKRKNGECLLRIPLDAISALAGAKELRGENAQKGVGGIDLVFVQEDGTRYTHRVTFNWADISAKGTPFIEVKSFKGC
ncbi:MAG: hypothetical protein Q4C88_02020 [Akkermansia sp.]|nr:hypothetical protein [Akkermansia sp.]